MIKTLLVFISPAYADRSVTQQERASIKKALADIGCTGGSYEVEDDDNVIVGYEVDNAKCSDGAFYDITLNKQFNIISRDRED